MENKGQSCRGTKGQSKKEWGKRRLSPLRRFFSKYRGMDKFREEMHPSP